MLCYFVLYEVGSQANWGCMYRGLAGEGSLSLKNTCVVWFLGWFVFFRCCFLLIMEEDDMGKYAYEFVNAYETVKEFSATLQANAVEFYSSKARATQLVEERRQKHEKLKQAFDSVLPYYRKKKYYPDKRQPWRSTEVLPHPEQNGEPKPLVRAGTPKRKRGELEEVVADEKITSPQTTTTQVPYIAYILAGKIPPN